MLEFERVDIWLRAVIRSEDDAWELLKRADEGEFANDIVLPRFDGWPTAEFTFWVDTEHEVLTASIMHGLLDFQSSLYRSFMLIEQGTTNLRGLKEEHKKSTEVRFRVVPGCTKLSLDLTEVAEKFAIQVGSQMTGAEVTVVAIAAILAWVSISGWKAWLANKTSIALSETSNNQVRAILEAQQFSQRADIDKTEILVGAINKAMGNKALWEASHQGKEGLLKTAAHVTSSEILGINIPPHVAKSMSRRTRMNPDEDILSGEFTILRVDTDVPDGFRARLQYIETGEEFFASVRDALLAPNDRTIISSAEWSKTPITAHVRVSRHRGVISSGEIIRVSENNNA